MNLLGLNIIDVLIVAVYLVGMLCIGKRLSRKVGSQDDFYLAGRKLGKLYQFFLNFGAMTDANGSASVASVVFKQGVGAVWIAMQTLFMTPYYWFMNVWFRRARLVTVGDLFEDRFKGKDLASVFAAFTIFSTVFIVAFGYMVSFKTMEALMVKPESQYSQVEKKMISDYEEYTVLDKAYKEGNLKSEKKDRYASLKSLYNKGRLRSYVSYIKPLSFYTVYGTVVGVYMIMGGFAAAVVTDAVQAILIIVFSFMLIPIGLFKLGGFSGLHDSVPNYMFRLFGSGALSEFTWYSILAILFTSTVQIHSVPNNMSVANSAKDEFAARMGPVTGGFGKRFMIIMWSICGLIAFGLYGNNLSNPDMVWGTITRDLLSPGLIGFMLAGILAANMSTLDAYSINLSALFVRNLYMPYVTNKTEGHYIYVGRLAIFAFLVLGALIALYMTGILSIMKFILAMNVTFGAPIFLIFKWRRLTKTAVYACVIGCVIIIIIIPLLVPLFENVRTSEALTIETYERIEYVAVAATQKDIDEGAADVIRENLTKEQKIAPVACFFEKVAHVDPYDTNSPLEGVGRFNAEVFIVSGLGVDVRNMTPPMLVTTRFLFDGIFPFVILFGVSYLTKNKDKENETRFYAKLSTPVTETFEKDQLEVQKSVENPEIYRSRKLLPSSNWEFYKWRKVDFYGFSFCCLAVAVILAIFYLLMNIGS